MWRSKAGKGTGSGAAIGVQWSGTGVWGWRIQTGVEECMGYVYGNDVSVQSKVDVDFVACIEV